MPTLSQLEKISLNIESYRLMERLLEENPTLKDIVTTNTTADQVKEKIKKWALDSLGKRDEALAYYSGEKGGVSQYEKLGWKDLATIRILDYVDNAGREFEDLNLRGEMVETDPFAILVSAAKQGTGGASQDFFEDMIHLFRQFTGKETNNRPSRKEVEKWMARYPSGLEKKVIELRKENRDRILGIIIGQLDRGEVKSSRYTFEEGMTFEEKIKRAREWWNEYKFHLKFAVRNPKLLNEMLDFSLDSDTLKILDDAEKAGIPFFVNPYYLSLLNTTVPPFAAGADLAIYQYVIYSGPLVEEFGKISAWEKEDIAEPGKPNAAGWLLPNHNVHRRYPDVAIIIPATMGRACGGLCSSCQRMYGFQDGNLNFDLEKLKPNRDWHSVLDEMLEYFEKDSQLRDILITGGDALMSSDKTLKNILDNLFEMIKRKIEANTKRADGDKYAEMVRVRLGTRLPVYLPQRVTGELIDVLSDFKKKASTVGLKQFVIQTHFESPMEITPEVEKCIQKLTSAGWTVTNQLVFTSAASRRGHTAKLRKELNNIGVLPYYTFSVKGYQENSENFATNERAVQEGVEEKIIGLVPQQFHNAIREFPLNAENMVENVKQMRKEANLPFLATDRTVLNLPGVGKSLTYRTIGITHDGRRILEFDHDQTREHSPIIKKMGKVIIIESKSVPEYLNQLRRLGENTEEYLSVYGYSIGETEPRMPIYEYPEYDFNITRMITNLEID